MSPEFMGLIKSIAVAILTGGFTLIGVVIKDNKKDAIRETTEEARFEKIECVIKTNQVLQNQKSEYVVKEIKNDIKRLEEKQDKYNHLQERTLKNEQSLKSLHHRMDEIVGGR